MGKRTYAIVFVCQAGELEIQSLLLAASLRRFARVEHELIAALPEPAARWGRPQERTLRLLVEWGIRTAPVTNQLDPDYPLANKISCLQVPHSADKLIFLDSDMLCLSELHDEERFAIPLNLKPADGATMTTDEAVWREVYRLCKVTPPTTRVRTTLRGQYTWPYFNSGFVALDRGIPLAEAWLDCCQKLDRKGAGPVGDRYWLEQTGLAVAVTKLKLSFDCLDERYNFPVHRKPLPSTRTPILCHYHWPQILRREPALMQMVQSLLNERPYIRQLMEQDAKWTPVAKWAEAVRTSDPGRASLPASRCLTDAEAGGSGGASPSRSPATYANCAALPDLIITGISRSGTSYLCNLLHRFDNCVVVNEPPQMQQAMAQHALPWGVATFYRDIRRDILEGTPIRNKLVNGQVTEDTLISNEACEYTPRVRTGGFVLGMKNTVSFLNRIEALRRVMPDARIVACVRNPFDTIASWKSSFKHLQTADVVNTPVGHPDDPWLSAQQRIEMTKVAAIEDPVQRRAAWWTYLSQLILDSLDRLILVRYDELALRPMDVLARILDGWDAGTPPEPVQPSSVRSKASEQLTPEDVQAIRAICSANAAALGVYRALP